MSDLLRCGRHHIERNHAKNYKGQNENQTTAAGSFLFRLRLFILVIFIRRLYIHTFMNDCLLDNRLPNFCIPAVRASRGEVNRMTLRAYFLFLSSLDAAVWAVCAVKSSAAILAKILQ